MTEDQQRQAQKTFITFYNPKGSESLHSTAIQDRAQQNKSFISHQKKITSLAKNPYTKFKFKPVQRENLVLSLKASKHDSINMSAFSEGLVSGKKMPRLGIQLPRQYPCVGIYDVKEELVKRKIARTIHMDLQSPEKYQFKPTVNYLSYNVNFKSIFPKNKEFDFGKLSSRNLIPQSNKRAQMECGSQLGQFPKINRCEIPMRLPLSPIQVDKLYRSTMVKYKVKLKAKENHYI